jgi:hypothetical protein
MGRCEPMFFLWEFFCQFTIEKEPNETSIKDFFGKCSKFLPYFVLKKKDFFFARLKQ